MLRKIIEYIKRPHWSWAYETSLLASCACADTILRKCRTGHVIWRFTQPGLESYYYDGMHAIWNFGFFSYILSADHEIYLARSRNIYERMCSELDVLGSQIVGQKPVETESY
jgi:hypothetical protein